jgi:sugar lactone lactonase YvrE
MRRLLLFAVAAALLAPAALAKSTFPPTIQLPNGWQPEGIAIGPGASFYAGSRATGAVYAGDLRTGAGNVFIQPNGGAATGMKVANGRLWVSGAQTGKGTVYDLKTGAVVREYQLAPGAPTFINDVTVAHHAAYFTDSQRPVIYKVELGRRHEPGAATTINLSGDYEHLAGFNLNGIAEANNGRVLLAVQSANGRLYSIDPTTGVATTVDLGGTVLSNGDGILLNGRTLYVVQNSLNKIAVLKMKPDFESGTLQRTITDPRFDVPTTIGRFGNKLYAVNARFSTPPTPDTTYTVVATKD